MRYPNNGTNTYQSCYGNQQNHLAIKCLKQNFDTATDEVFAVLAVYEPYTTSAFHTLKHIIDNSHVYQITNNFCLGRYREMMSADGTKYKTPIHEQIPNSTV